MVNKLPSKSTLEFKIFIIINNNLAKEKSTYFTLNLENFSYIFIKNSLS